MQVVLILVEMGDGINAAVLAWRQSAVEFYLRRRVEWPARTNIFPAKSANSMQTMRQKAAKNTTQFSPEAIQKILDDYKTCCLSRECSVLARKEVLTGKAKFGIIGDGKELPQVALASVFEKGDWRSGYYRDQTLIFSLGLMTVEQFFAQLYADSDHDIFSKGRQMNCHFNTATIDERGNWLTHRELLNISADIAPTGGQMARGLGLAFASKKFRASEVLNDSTGFSKNGNEVCFVTIGDASTSEGVFWETMNAAGVLQVPMVVSVWDDGYGISVPKKYQTTKSSISAALAGFQFDGEKSGIEIYRVKAWDYAALVETYQKATDRARRLHIPALVHVEEVTQQLGHSTSGDHRRYKSEERLQFELDFDCNRRFAEWIVEAEMASVDELKSLENEANLEARRGQAAAYQNSLKPAQKAQAEVAAILKKMADETGGLATELLADFEKMRSPAVFETARFVRQSFHFSMKNGLPIQAELADWLENLNAKNRLIYAGDLYSSSEKSPLRVPVEPAVYAENAPEKNAFEILNRFFDLKLATNPLLFAFGEDVGQIGDVNQGFAGLQAKHGKNRVFDTGIREWTIMGQAIGMAMRGLRPIAEIQYLDYLIYGLSPLADDLACLRYRSGGQQIAPAIIRTRGHRLEGIWHTGSPIQMMLGSLRGLYICMPRNMVQAAGMYNTLLAGDDPAIVVECLNGYRLKERQPENLGSFTVPLGSPEILRAGTDVTIVTYGSCCRIADDACRQLERLGISVELIDCQTLVPFDLENQIVESLKKTNRILFLDEDVPGGASSYLMQKVLEGQGGYRFLDAAPRTLTAIETRPPYGSDGDYWSKPSAEDVVEMVLEMMGE